MVDRVLPSLAEIGTSREIGQFRVHIYSASTTGLYRQLDIYLGIITQARLRSSRRHVCVMHIKPEREISGISRHVRNNVSHRDFVLWYRSNRARQFTPSLAYPSDLTRH